MTWLIVGLGNPGKKYEKTRHNVGFRVVDALVAEQAGVEWKKKFEAEVAEGRVGRAKVVFLKPLTYMNESGRAVQAAAKFWKIPATNIVVIHDDKDLSLGQIRVR
ncbi:MAG: aminoacyl-tRNA hydrolase, partial [Patescibacteria group bacterium]|nr:aminoacyl-tRNA hydrolase [Patescibacteria group bacterium]